MEYSIHLTLFIPFIRSDLYFSYIGPATKKCATAEAKRKDATAGPKLVTSLHISSSGTSLKPDGSPGSPAPTSCVRVIGTTNSVLTTVPSQNNNDPWIKCMVPITMLNLLSLIIFSFKLLLLSVDLNIFYIKNDTSKYKCIMNAKVINDQKIDFSILDIKSLNFISCFCLLVHKPVHIKLKLAPIVLYRLQAQVHLQMQICKLKLIQI